MADPKESQKLKWWVPRWSRARDVKKLAPQVFGLGPIVRIAGVSIIVGVVICLAVKIAIPQTATIR